MILHGSIQLIDFDQELQIPPSDRANRGHVAVRLNLVVQIKRLVPAIERQETTHCGYYGRVILCSSAPKNVVGDMRLRDLTCG